MSPCYTRGIKDNLWALCPMMTLYLAKSKLGGPVGAGVKQNMSQWCIIFTTQEPGAGKIGSTQEWGTCFGKLKSCFRPAGSEVMAGQLSENRPCQPLSWGGCEVLVGYKRRPLKGKMCDGSDVSGSHLWTQALILAQGRHKVTNHPYSGSYGHFLPSPLSRLELPVSKAWRHNPCLPGTWDLRGKHVTCVIQCVWCLSCLFTPTGRSTSLGSLGSSGMWGLNAGSSRINVAGGLLERSEVKRPESASGRDNNPQGLGKRATPGYTAKGRAKLGPSPSRGWEWNWNHVPYQWEGSYSNHPGLTQSGRQRERYCALRTLRRGAPPGQEGEEQAEESIVLNMLSTVIVVALAESIFILWTLGLLPEPWIWPWWADGLLIPRNWLILCCKDKAGNVV